MKWWQRKNKNKFKYKIDLKKAFDCFEKINPLIKINQELRKTHDSNNNRPYSPSKRFYCKLLTMYLFTNNSKFRIEMERERNEFLFFLATNEKNNSLNQCLRYYWLCYCYCRCNYTYKLSFRCEWDVSRTVPVWEEKSFSIYLNRSSLDVTFSIEIDWAHRIAHRFTISNHFCVVSSFFFY